MADRYRVAIVVATEVEAVDYADASSIAETAVKQALGATGTWSSTYPHLTVQATKRDDAWPVGVQSIRPLDMALRNGHVRLEVAPPRHTAEEEDPNV